MIERSEGSAVKYETVAEAYRDLEQATGRLALTERLAALLAGTPDELLPTVCYLCQGLIAPEFAGVDLGLAEKLAVRAVATATGAGPEQVTASVRETGDLGQAAQRLSDATEILAKLGGRCAAEYKYDGVRVQAHRTADGQIELFTRRLERVATQFPDVVEVLAAGLGPAEAIVEGEVVAFDPAAGELRPFQEVMFRRRKYGISDAVRDVPVGLFCFELLYADGQDLTRLSYPERRARVDARQQPDVWFEPGLVLEILSAELTLSPNYTAAWGQIKEHAGLAMRFPRFTGRWRDDKTARDATTTGELTGLYRTALR